jgi:hypothetical protein
VTISGKLTNGSTPATVYLWQEAAGQSSFTRIAQTAANADGDYSFSRGAWVVLTNTSWYTSTAGATSPTLLQRVSARVRLAKSAVDGALVKFSGYVSPSHRGEHVLLQRYTSAKHWDTIAKAVIVRMSRFTVAHRFTHGGETLMRAVFKGDARNTRSTSPPLKIFVH